MEPPAEILRADLKAFTRTNGTRLAGVSFSEEKIDFARLRLTPGIRAVNSNYGHVVHAAWPALLKRPPPPRPAQPGRRNHQPRGDGSCFNSCLELVTDVPPGVRARLPATKERYAAKLFRTGSVQVYGVMLPQQEDAAAVVELLRAFVCANPMLSAAAAAAAAAAADADDAPAPAPVAIRLPGDVYEAPVRYVASADVVLAPAPAGVHPALAAQRVIENYKTEIALPPGTIIDFAAMQRGLSALTGLPFRVARCQLQAARTPKLQFALWVTPDRNVLVNVYQQGKVNVLGLSEGTGDRVAAVGAAIGDIFRRLWRDVVVALPEPDAE